MLIDFLLNEPASPAMQLNRSAWTGRIQLYADGTLVPMQPKNGIFDQQQTYSISMSDGSQRQLVLKNRLYDSVPEALVDGQPLALAKALQPWEYMVACVPLLLVFGAGLLGGGIGVGSSFINLNIMRSKQPKGLQVALVLGVTVVAFGLVVLLAGLLQLAVAS